MLAALVRAVTVIVPRGVVVEIGSGARARPSPSV